MSDLLDLLAARSGTVCAVGAGGKKTTLHYLASLHPGRVGLTSTVPMAHFPSTLGAHEVIADPDGIVEAVARSASTHRLVAFAHPDVKKARYGGLAPNLIAEIQAAARFDVVLVKCDGARMRWIKAPEGDEPLLPEGATTVVPVVSAKAIGKPLSEEIAHRPHRVEDVTGARIGEPLTPSHVAHLLTHEQGALKGTGSATVVPVINMVDDSELEAAALETARCALDLTGRFDRVVLMSHLSPDRLVSVVTRS
jgi:probable selenium-dependent hydroxylase accessory protein YqeC